MADVKKAPETTHPSKQHSLKHSLNDDETVASFCGSERRWDASASHTSLVMAALVCRGPCCADYITSVGKSNRDCYVRYHRNQSKNEELSEFVYVSYAELQNAKTDVRLWGICFSWLMFVHVSVREKSFSHDQTGKISSSPHLSLCRMPFTKGNIQPLIPQSDCSGRFSTSSLWKRRSSSYVSIQCLIAQSARHFNSHALTLRLLINTVIKCRLFPHETVVQEQNLHTLSRSLNMNMVNVSLQLRSHSSVVGGERVLEQNPRFKMQ